MSCAPGSLNCGFCICPRAPTTTTLSRVSFAAVLKRLFVAGPGLTAIEIRESSRVPVVSSPSPPLEERAGERRPFSRGTLISMAVGPGLACVTLLSLLALPAVCRGQYTATNQWSLRIGLYGFCNDSSPALGRDGTIYFGTFDGKLWAVSPGGSCRWTFVTGMEIKSSPAIDAQGTIYFGCRDRRLYAVSPEGNKQWAFTTGAWVDASPALGSDGTVCFGSWDHNFYALSPDGAKKWQFRTGAAIVSSAAIDAQGRIYFGSHDRKFYALEPDGKKAWEYATEGPIISSPALQQNGGLYVTSVDGWLYSLNRDGTMRWRLRTGGITESSPVIGQDGSIYVGVNDRLWAISSDGNKQWERKEDDLIDAPPVVFADGLVGVVSRYGLLRTVSEDQIKWTFYLYPYGCASPAVGRSGTIYVPGLWNFFVALAGSAPLAPTSWPKFRANARNTGNLKDNT